MWNTGLHPCQAGSPLQTEPPASSLLLTQTFPSALNTNKFSFLEKTTNLRSLSQASTSFPALWALLFLAVCWKGPWSHTQSSGPCFTSISPPACLFCYALLPATTNLKASARTSCSILRWYQGSLLSHLPLGFCDISSFCGVSTIPFRFPAVFLHPAKFSSLSAPLLGHSPLPMTSATICGLLTVKYTYPDFRPPSPVAHLALLAGLKDNPGPLIIVPMCVVLPSTLLFSKICF